VKIVDVNEFYAEQGGGVKTYVNQKLEAAARLGHELVVVAPGPRDEETHRLGGKVIWVKGPPMPFDPRYYVMHRRSAVHRIIDALRPDVIEGSSPWTAGWFAATYRGPGAKAWIYHQDPVAVYPHTFGDRLISPRVIDGLCFPYWKYIGALARRFDATVVAGQWLAERLRSFGIANAQAVPFGIDRQLFSPDHRDARVRAQLLEACGAPPGAALCVAISRFHPEKRLPTVIAGVQRVARHQPVGLVVFGDGPFRKAIDRAVSRAPNVHLAGFVRDRAFIAKALASADVFVHGSAAETYGFVIAEAASSGAAIVAPNRGGAFDLVDETFSELYTPGDAAGCADAIMRALRRDRERLRRAASEYSARKVRSTSDHFEGLFDLYARLAEQSRSR